MAEPWKEYQGAPNATAPWEAYATPDAPAEKPQTLEGLARAVGAGVRAGVEGLVSLPGTVEDVVEGAYEGAGNLMFNRTPEEIAARDAAAFEPTLSSPNMETVQQAATSVLGEPYQPQTTAEEYLKTTGEFIPAAAAGPGGLVRKAAMAVLPGVASETAGQLTEGTTAEPFARIGGAILGGMGAASKMNTQAKKILKQAPSAKDLKIEKDRIYSALRDADVRYDNNEYQRMVVSLARELKKNKVKRHTADAAMSWMDELTDMIGKPLDFEELDAVRKNLGGIARSGGAAAMDMKNTASPTTASAMIRVLDDFLYNAPFVTKGGSVVANRSELQGLIKTAREYGKRHIKNRVLEDIIQDAKLYKSGFTNGLQLKIGSYLRTKQGKKLFPKGGAERAALIDVSVGGQGRQFLEMIGKFGIDLNQLRNTGFFPLAMQGGAGAAGVGAGMATGNPVPALIAGGALTTTTAAKFAGQKGVTNALDRAGQLIRGGSPAQIGVKEARKSEKVKASIRRMLSGYTALQAGP